MKIYKLFFIFIFAIFFSSCEEEQYKLIENRNEDFITISDFKQCCFSGNEYYPKCHGKEFYLKGHISDVIQFEKENFCYINDIKTGESMRLTLSSFNNQAIINKINNADRDKTAYIIVVAIAVYMDYGSYKKVKLVIADADNIIFD